MAKHALCELSDFPSSGRGLFTVKGRPIVVFRLEDRFFGLFNRCPHEGASLYHGSQVGLVTSTGPGKYCYDREQEIIRCPWHGWEFDIKTGKSVCEPDRFKTRTFAVSVEKSQCDAAAGGELTAEKIDVFVENSSLFVEM
jgi:3-phenylpropionate/trans-cinnamate dioxygenase ferredoxin subunit